MNDEISSYSPVLDNETIKSTDKEDEPPAKKFKLGDTECSAEVDESVCSPTIIENIAYTTSVSKSPKKRLDVPKTSSSKPYTKEKFIYGNYSRYYGYRNQESEDYRDIRLDAFKEHKELFEAKDILDIGCNSGMLTMEISKTLNVKSIYGIDIDKSLTNKSTNYLRKQRKNFKGTDRSGFPFNINFIHGNYILRNDVLLEIEEQQFDLILCLSVTKWMHLNFADAGLKQAFKRMFLQLRPGGKLILEAQPWNNYKRRKKLTPEIFENYKSITFFPKEFQEYLLSAEIGFNECIDIKTPQHAKEGFRRPIQVFIKNM